MIYESYGYDPPQHNTHSYWLPIDSTSHIDISSCFGYVVCIGRLIAITHEGATHNRHQPFLEKTLFIAIDYEQKNSVQFRMHTIISEWKCKK